MKNRKNLFILPTLMIVILLYLTDSVTAAASAQPNGETVAGSAAEPEAGQPTEPTAEPEAGQPTEPAAEPEEEQSLEPAAESVEEPAAVPELVSTGAELMAWLKSHEHTGGSVELTGDIVLDEPCVFVWAGASPTEHIFVETAGHTITVSGKAEFWSNAYLTFRGQTGAYGIFHVTEGGMLSLSGVSVESGQYGDQPPESAALYALWQEEGAGLVISDCQVSGEIHYADTPFVMYRNSTYVLVGEGQAAADVLPSEMRCSVNYQGQVSNNKPVQVTWNLAETEEQQEKRLRFLVQGSFSHAVSETPPVCAVVYNDHPLTFTEVEARVSSDFYIFQGGYTQPEDLLQMTVVSEYSFDGENWFVCDDTAGMDGVGTFFISIQSEQWDTREHPYLYIRLQGDFDGIRYFSNVLGYKADNLEAAEDHGGDRGGGISEASPSAEPQKETDNVSADDRKVSGTVPKSGEDGAGTDTKSAESTGTGAKSPGSAGNSTGTGTKSPGSAGNSTGTGTKSSGSADGSEGTDTKSPGSADGSEDTDTKSSGSAGGSTDTGPEGSTGSSGTGMAGNGSPSGANLSEAGKSPAANLSGAESSSGTNASGAEMTSVKDTIDTGQPSDTAPVSGRNVVSRADTAPQNAVFKSQGLTAERGERQSRTIVIVLGFVALSAAAGAAGFCFHTEIFRRLFQTVREMFR